MTPSGTTPATGVAKPGLRQALLELAEQVFHRCRELETAPVVVTDVDWWHRQRDGQEGFAVARRLQWQAPRAEGSALFFRDFPAWQRLGQVIEQDPDLADWIETLIGPEHSRQGRSFLGAVNWFFNRLVTTTRSYEVNDLVFDQLYGELESGWLARTVVVTDYVPLIGFESSEQLIPLPGGYVLRRMTDQEIDAAVTRGAVPARDPSNPGRVTVSRFDQWALVHEETVPVIAGPREEAASYLGLPVAELEAAAQRLITGLRVVVGGSVLATRVVRRFHVSVLDPPSESAVLGRFGSIDPDRPCILHAIHLTAIAAVWQHLRDATGADPLMQLVLRRLVLAGGRSDPVDRLLDLMIAVEALVEITGAGRGSTGSPGTRLGRHIAGLAGMSQAVGVDPGDIEVFMSRASRAARNQVIHADAAGSSLHYRLKGTTAELAEMVDDLDRVIRLTVRHLLTGAVD